MSIIYSGSTPKYAIRVKDRTGVQLDPSSVGQIVDMRVWVLNSVTGEVIAKRYLNAVPSPSEGWLQARVKEVAPGDNRVLFYLTTSETLLAPTNTSDIQVEITFPDPDYPDGKRIEITKGRFYEIQTAKTI